MIVLYQVLLLSSNTLPCCYFFCHITNCTIPFSFCWCESYHLFCHIINCTIPFSFVNMHAYTISLLIPFSSIHASRVMPHTIQFPYCCIIICSFVEPYYLFVISQLALYQFPLIESKCPAMLCIVISFVISQIIPIPLVVELECSTVSLLSYHQSLLFCCEPCHLFCYTVLISTALQFWFTAVLLFNVSVAF